MGGEGEWTSLAKTARKTKLLQYHRENHRRRKVCLPVLLSFDTSVPNIGLLG